MVYSRLPKVQCKKGASNLRGVEVRDNLKSLASVIQCWNARLPRWRPGFVSRPMHQHCWKARFRADLLAEAKSKPAISNLYRMRERKTSVRGIPKREVKAYQHLSNEKAKLLTKLVSHKCNIQKLCKVKNHSHV